MIREQLQAACELIAEGEYELARVLLRRIDHPEARAMLAELDARREEGSTRFTALEGETRRKQRSSREFDLEFT